MSRAVARLVQDISARADKGDYFDVTHELKRLGLDVVGRTAFGIDFLTPLRDMPNVQLSSKCPFADLKQVAEAFQKASESMRTPVACRSGCGDRGWASEGRKRWHLHTPHHPRPQLTRTRVPTLRWACSSTPSPPSCARSCRGSWPHRASA